MQLTIVEVVDCTARLWAPRCGAVPARRDLREAVCRVHHRDCAAAGQLRASLGLAQRELALRAGGRRDGAALCLAAQVLVLPIMNYVAALRRRTKAARTPWRFQYQTWAAP